MKSKDKKKKFKKERNLSSIFIKGVTNHINIIEEQEKRRQKLSNDLARILINYKPST